MIYASPPCLTYYLVVRFRRGMLTCDKHYPVHLLITLYLSYPTVKPRKTLSNCSLWTMYAQMRPPHWNLNPPSWIQNPSYRVGGRELNFPAHTLYNIMSSEHQSILYQISSSILIESSIIPVTISAYQTITFPLHHHNHSRIAWIIMHHWLVDNSQSFYYTQYTWFSPCLFIIVIIYYYICNSQL